MHIVLRRQHDAVVSAHRHLAFTDVAVAADRRLEEKVASDDHDSVLDSVDVSKATMTQIFAVAMAILVLRYTVPLMWSIVLVNGYFDRHHDLLVKQKESHRIRQSDRELVARETEEEPEPLASGVAEGPETSASGDPPASGQAPEAQAQQAPGVPVEDPECRRYERMLDMAIESVKKTRERFPFKLFGFVISAQLLCTWVVLAAAPALDQAKQLAPALALRACDYAGRSTWVKHLQEAIDARKMPHEWAQGATDSLHIHGFAGGISTVFGDRAAFLGKQNGVRSKNASHGAVQRRLVVPPASNATRKAARKIDIRKIIHENICLPLKGLVKEKMQEAFTKENVEGAAMKAYREISGQREIEAETQNATEQDAAEGEKGQQEEQAARRLLGAAGPDGDPRGPGDLTSLVLAWWDAHPGLSRDTKTAMVHWALQELKQGADRLLQRAPREVLRTFRNDGVLGHFAALALLRNALASGGGSHGLSIPDAEGWGQPEL